MRATNWPYTKERLYENDLIFMDVRPATTLHGERGMIHMSLFSGIGGFELAAEWMGWDNMVSCEINDFGRKVLDYYWPNAYHHDDIHTLTYDRINEELTQRYGASWRSDDIILTGGFPCQPYSAAGKRLGKEDDRHLWPQMCRIIREVRPTWVVGENVFGLVNWNDGMVFNEVQADLEAEGYEVQPYVLPAASVGAPHRRDRVWFVAHSMRSGYGGESETPRPNNPQEGAVRENIGQHRDGVWCKAERCGTTAPDPDRDAEATSNPYISTKGSRQIQLRGRNERISIPNNWHNFPTKPPVRSRNDGLSSELLGITVSKHRNESIKAYGNAIVPQVAHQIFKAIQQYKDQQP